MICRLPANVKLASGYWPLNGLSYLVFPAKGQPTLIVPAAERDESACAWWPRKVFEWAHLDAGDTAAQIKAHLDEAIGKGGMRKGKVALEMGAETMAPPLNTAEPFVVSHATIDYFRGLVAPAGVVDATPMLDQLKSVKTPDEVIKLRRVAEIAGFGFRAFASAIRRGAREVDIAAVVACAVQVKGSGHRGAVNVRAFTQVSSGPANTLMAFRPAEISSVRKIRRGDLVVLEMALVVDGMWGDYTRVAVVGRPNSRQVEVYAMLRRAQEAAMAACKPGVSSGDVDRAARTVLNDAGLGKYFIHITGHGVGFGYHDPAPFLVPGGTLTLQEGMVFTVEPGVYFKGFGGMRIEDDVVLTAKGAQYLHDNGRSLITGG